jgi:hypothetical protein
MLSYATIYSRKNEQIEERAAAAITDVEKTIAVPCGVKLKYTVHTQN